MSAPAFRQSPLSTRTFSAFVIAAAVFAIEALARVDHFDFLDSMATGNANCAENKSGAANPKTKTQTKKPSVKNAPPASKQQAAVDAGWLLSTSDRWARRYFHPKDLRSRDRELFA